MTLLLCTLTLLLCTSYAHSDPRDSKEPIDTLDDATVYVRLAPSLRDDPLSAWIAVAKELDKNIQNVPNTPGVLLLLLSANQIAFVVRRDPEDTTLLIVRCLRLNPSNGAPRAAAWLQRSVQFFTDQPPNNRN